MDKLIAYVVLGACIGLGVKAIDWTIPSRPKTIVVCMNSDTGAGICKDLGEVEAAHRAGRTAFAKDHP